MRRKFTNLGYKTLLHSPYSLDLSPTDYRFFKHLDKFVRNKTFRSKKDAESAFMNFSASKSQDFYQCFLFLLLL